MKFKILDDYKIDGKRVLVRVDFNVPMANEVVLDESRIRAVLPTLKYLQKHGAKIILMSHVGRPKGKKEKKFSLRPIISVLKHLLADVSVEFCEEAVGINAEQKANLLRSKDILLLENLRFYSEEENNDETFAEALSRLGDIYVNDAFSASHRAHASIDKITKFLPSCAGRLLESELKSLEKLLEHPKKPVVAILGGAKISTKLSLIENLIKKVDVLLIGGGMASTLLDAQGVFIGESLCEPSLKDRALSIIDAAQKNQCHLVLSQDVVVVNAEKKEGRRTTSVQHIKEGEMIVDIGPQTIEAFQTVLQGAKTVVWNGPLGMVEVAPFDKGTCQIAKFLSEQKEMVTVLGGGDTVAVLNKLGILNKFSYVSMAGGAFLEWLEGRSLPGLVALEQHAN